MLVSQVIPERMQTLESEPTRRTTTTTATTMTMTTTMMMMMIIMITIIIIVIIIIIIIINMMVAMRMRMRVPLSSLAVDLSVLWLSALCTQQTNHAMLHQSESEKRIQQITNHFPKSMQRNAGY